MGCCASLATTTKAGHRVALEEVPWDGSYDPHLHGLEIGGIPLDHFLKRYSDLGPEDHDRVVKMVKDQVPSQSSWTGVGLCRRRPVRVGTISWNVGGITDNRKDKAHIGIEEAVRGAVIQVLHAAVEGMGRPDVIVVGLQEVISLTPSNALHVPSSLTDSRRHGGNVCGWPETVAQWVELVTAGVNDNIKGKSGSRNALPNNRGAYALYGQPVYLFGMLLCVLCQTDLLRHIKDFSITEMAMDGKHVGRGAKGVVACRFILFDRSFCFLNCHLSAEKKESAKYRRKSYQKRLKQLQHCWDEVKFRSHLDQMIYPVKAHRAVFLLGDTNMRLFKPFLNWSQAEVHERITVTIQSGRYEELWKHDQLCWQQQRKSPESLKVGGMVLSDGIRGARDRSLAVSSAAINTIAKSALAAVRDPTKTDVALDVLQEAIPGTEMGPTFPPTYKLEVPGPGYSQKRVPAWTDRVLYRSQHVHPETYDSVLQSEILTPPRNISDHNPVYASFSVDCISVNLAGLSSLIRRVTTMESSRKSSVLYEGLSLQAGIRELVQHHAEEHARRLYHILTSEMGQASDALEDHSVGLILNAEDECWQVLCRQLEDEIEACVRKSREASRGLETDVSTSRSDPIGGARSGEPVAMAMMSSAASATATGSKTQTSFNENLEQSLETVLEGVRQRGFPSGGNRLLLTSI
mmetsp:Transcript_59790/g.129518  ORF Transcript_59790/g.129518 Transcript_59790/m.129518 type:complete len:689 (-) Transcript_59790:19-2085(-)